MVSTTNMSRQFKDTLGVEHLLLYRERVFHANECVL